ncbi:hypothetical protein [Spiroplasma endosymbiont of Nebria brevicollis]|uniref:hypothetical protein n=1 Tax=Spiroplasma endosymbiont of Nebria brevicollis TaxID=3066284 RepID=UPI00313B4933
MTEIEKLLEMNYEYVCDYLKNKYGNVPKDYFVDKTILLSTPEWARISPFNYQKADRLVYCNLLEHLVLHIKIFEYPYPNKNPMMAVGVGGIFEFIVPELNDIYSGIQYKQPWKQKVIENIISLKTEYFKCIKKIIELNFPYSLLNSFNTKYGLWNNEIYEQLKKLIYFQKKLL